MNLSQMISYIDNNALTILTEQLPGEDYGNYLFIRVTYEVKPNIAQQQSLCIVVKDRDGPEETAYVKGDFPSYLQPSTFKDEVTTAINNYQSTHSELEYWKFSSIDEEKEVAHVTAYEYDGVEDVINQVEYMLYKIDSVLTFRKVVSV